MRSAWGGGMLLLVGTMALAGGDDLPTPADARKALARSLPYVEAGGLSWMARRTSTDTTSCVSCHRVAFVIWSHNDARRLGFDVDAPKIESWTQWSLERMVARGKEGGGLDTMSQILLARDLTSRWPAAKPVAERTGTDHYVTMWENIIERQSDDGSWAPEGQLKHAPEITTGWALLALAPRDVPADSWARNRQRALDYLKACKPDPGTEAMLLRFLVEKQFGDPGRAVELRKELIGRQNEDGGWAYRGGEKLSDAYATGQVLYALSGDFDAHGQIQKAWRFLISTQQPDGSWAVPTTAIHAAQEGSNRTKKTDEIYTYWGSAWATIGLIRTLPMPVP